MSVIVKNDGETFKVSKFDRKFGGEEADALVVNGDGSMNLGDGAILIDSDGMVDIPGGLAGSDVADGAITTAKLAASAVTDTKLATDAVTTAKIAALAVTAAKLAADAVTTAKIAALAVTAAKALVFASTEQTGTGSSQNVAHGLAATPSIVLLVATAGHDGMGGAGDLMPVLTEGSHDSTNVVATVSAGAKFKVFAWA